VGPRRGGRAEGREDHTQVALGVERAARGSERGEREGGDILNDQPLHELSKWTTITVPCTRTHLRRSSIAR
jgi:hypothetical protein